MPNNIAVSVSADIVDYTGKMAVAKATAQDLGKTMKAVAREVAAGDTSAETATRLAVVTEEYAKADRTVSLWAGKLNAAKAVQAQAAAATTAETLAVEANTGAHISNRAAREGLVLVHEALSGNYHRMIGSLMIEAQALSGAEGASKALSAVMSPMGLAFIGAAVAIGAVVAATISYENAQEKLTATTLGLGAASGLSADQLREAGAVAAEWSGQSVRASTESAEAFASAGVRSEHSIEALSASVQTYAALTGEKAADAQKELAEAMRDPIKGAETLNEKLGILDATQMKQIRTAIEQGDIEKADAIITDAWTQRQHDANAAGIGLNDTWQNMTSRLSDLWGWLGKVGDAMKGVAEEEQAMRNGSYGAYVGAQGAAKQSAAHGISDAQKARLNQESAAALPLVLDTPEGKDAAGKSDLEGKLKKLQTALAAETKLHGANTEAAREDAAAIAEYTRAINTYIPAAEKAHRIAELDAQISEAKRKHDKDAVENLSKQKEMLNLSGQVMSSGEASQRASDAADKSGASTGAGSKGPSVVSQWEQQLHQQEIASGEFFKDQTSSELAFWQGKLALTKSGSKDWLDIQSKIYDAEKTLARQGYQEHLAALNDRLEADHGDWAREKSDWDEKLAYIASKFGEESAEYQNAHREMQRDQRQHDDEMFRQQQEASKKAFDAFKKQIDDQRKAREDTARGNEDVIRSDAGSSPFGDVSADIKIGAIHAQLIQQEIADLARLQKAKDDSLEKQKASALSTYGAEAKQYKDLIDAKTQADQDYAAQKQVLDAKMRQQSIQDILALQQTYHGYVDGVVNSTVTGLDGVISRQKTWAQMGIGIYQELAQQFERIIEKMATEWIVKHVFMTAAQRQQLMIQQAQQNIAAAQSTASTVAGETAKTVAVTVGGQARVAATATASGESAAIVGLHNMKEITSHAATAAAAAYHAMAGIPVVGPILGAAAAAATFAAVEGYGMLASFAKGTNELPSDMIAQVHQGERIVPAADNAKLLAAVDRGTGGAGGLGAPISLIHSPTIHAYAEPNMRDLLERGHSDMVDWVNRAFRGGHIKLPR